MGAANESAAIIACYSEIMGKRSKDNSFQGPEVSALISQASDYLRRGKNRAKSVKIGRTTRGLSSSGFGLVPRPARWQMLRPASTWSRSNQRLFLLFAGRIPRDTNVFICRYRIIHRPTFWLEYEKYWVDPGGVSPSLRLKALLVVGIGSSLYDHGDNAAALRNIGLVQQ